MLYGLLGRVVWRGAKRYLKRRYGRPSPMPKRLIGVAAAATVAGALGVLQRRSGQ